MRKSKADLVGPIEQAAQQELRQLAALLLEQAARVEKIERRLKRTPGYRVGFHRMRQADPENFLWTVALECFTTCDEVAAGLRERAEHIREAGDATPRSLAAKLRAQVARSMAYDKREAAKVALKARQDRNAQRRQGAILRRADREAKAMLERVRRLRPAVDGCAAGGRALDVQIGLEDVERELALIAESTVTARAPKVAA